MNKLSQTTYPVNDIYLSIQGEGHLAGTPMAILRLQGCDVGCPWCDTKYTWEISQEFQVENLSQIQASPNSWAFASPQEITLAIQALCIRENADISWVLLTGGEPTTYYLHPLLHALHLAGFKVALETSGAKSMDITSEKFDWFTISPKHLPVISSNWPLANEIKQVIVKDSDIPALQETLRNQPILPNTIISLQPVSQGKHQTQLCVGAALEHGWQVSIQIHKILNLP